MEMQTFRRGRGVGGGLKTEEKNLV